MNNEVGIKISYIFLLEDVYQVAAKLRSCDISFYEFSAIFLIRNNLCFCCCKVKVYQQKKQQKQYKNNAKIAQTEKYA